MAIYAFSSAQVFSSGPTISSLSGASLFLVFTENLKGNNFHWAADSINKFQVWWKS